MQKKHFDKDPELKQHYEELGAKCGRADPEMMEFKRLIGSARMGNFKVVPELRVIQRNTKLKNWGQNVKLGSWKEVLDKHGEDVAYAALRQGTLAHVPHTLLKEGHGVRWPESHQFIMEESWWTCLLYTSPSPRDLSTSRMPSSA